MAQSQGDGVGSIVRLRHLLQSQEPLGHVHHLMLGGITITYDRLFHLSGFIGGNLHTGLPDRQENNASCLGNTDTGGNILTEEQLFNGHHIRLCHLQQLHHVIVNDLQPPGKFRVGGCGNGTAVEQLKLPSLGIDQPKAGDAVAGVDSKDPYYRTAPKILQ